MTPVMRRFVFATINLFSALFCVAQYQSYRKPFSLSSEQGPVPSAHIMNITQKRGAISDTAGSAFLPIEPGDTVQISCIGFKTAQFVPDSTIIDADTVYITIGTDTIALREIIINRQWQLAKKMSKMSAAYEQSAMVQNNISGATQYAVKNSAADAYADHYFNGYPVKGTGSGFSVNGKAIHYYINLLKK